jgi:hypothetical protein
MKEEFVYEVLVSADTAEYAEQVVLTSGVEWGEPISIETHTYDVIELQEKKDDNREVNFDDWGDESRTDVVGQNGNEGLHYEETKDGS